MASHKGGLFSFSCLEDDKYARQSRAHFLSEISVKSKMFFNTHPQLTCDGLLLDTFSLPVLTVDWFSHFSIRL